MLPSQRHAICDSVRPIVMSVASRTDSGATESGERADLLHPTVSKDIDVATTRVQFRQYNQFAALRQPLLRAVRSFRDKC